MTRGCKLALLTPPQNSSIRYVAGRRQAAPKTPTFRISRNSGSIGQPYLHPVDQLDRLGAVIALVARKSLFTLKYANIYYCPDLPYPVRFTQTVSRGCYEASLSQNDSSLPPRAFCQRGERLDQRLNRRSTPTRVRKGAV
jgi:hypothetical protein